MASNTDAKLSWFWYGLYGVVLCTVLLYVRFPFAQLQSYCATRIEQAIPWKGSSVGQIGYKFPFSLTVNRLSLSSLDKTQNVNIIIEDVVVTPVLKSFGKDYELTGRVYSGVFEGTLQLNLKESSYLLSKVTVNNVNLEQISYFKKRFKRNISGDLSLSRGVFAGKLGDGKVLQLEGDILVKSGEIELLQPILTLKTIKMKQLKVSFGTKNSVVTISKGSFSGSELNAKFNGNIDINPKNKSQKVLLTGDINLQQEFLRGKPQVLRMVKRLRKQYGTSSLPFKVNGTVDNPKFGFTK